MPVVRPWLSLIVLTVVFACAFAPVTAQAAAKDEEKEEKDDDDARQWFVAERREAALQTDKHQQDGSLLPMSPNGHQHCCRQQQEPISFCGHIAKEQYQADVKEADNWMGKSLETMKIKAARKAANPNAKQ